MSRAAKEAFVVVWDVGPTMAAHLPHLRRSMFLLAESKLLNAPGHEVAFVLFGTSGTDNEVNRELADAGDPDQYSHISVAVPVLCTSLDTLRVINAVECGSGSSDYISALLVGLDLLKKACVERPALAGARVKRHLLLVSALDTPVEPPVDDELLQQVAGQFTALDTSLHVTITGHTATQTNLADIDALLARVAGSVRTVTQPAQLGALFVLKEPRSTGFNYPLRIGRGCTIEVQVFKKSDLQKLPNLSAYNIHAGQGGSGRVKAETLYYDPADQTQPLAAQEKVRAYKYGKQLVPIPDAATEALMRHCPGKALDLIGFTSRDNVPRWQFASEAWVALACQAGKAAQYAVALSALVKALQQENKVAVLRYARTDKSEAVLMAGLPLPAPPAALDCLDGLLLVRLPFRDDMRYMAFRSFSRDTSKPHLVPSKQQTALMQQLVGSLRLAPVRGATAPAAAAAAAQPEQLVPDDTLNPLMQRFYYYMGQRALDPHLEVEDARDDVLAAEVLDPRPPEQLPQEAQQALAALPQAFPVVPRAPKAVAGVLDVDAAAAAAAAAAEAAGAPGAAPQGGALVADEGGVRRVSGVSTAQPVEDFHTLLRQGLVEQAFKGLQAAVHELVEQSTGARLYGRAAEALAALRASAVEQQQPGAFNACLDSLREAFKGHPAKADFWRQLMASRVAPISSDEAPGAGVSREAAAEYVRVHSQAADAEGAGPSAAAQQQAAALEVEAEEDDDDEFAGVV